MPLGHINQIIFNDHIGGIIRTEPRCAGLFQSHSIPVQRVPSEGNGIVAQSHPLPIVQENIVLDEVSLAVITVIDLNQKGCALIDV